MPIHFEGARAKVGRAWEQVDCLQADFERFYREQTYETPQVLDLKSGRKNASFRITKDFPVDWPVRIGEVGHNLRSALDQAIYDLTVENTGGPLDKTEFPVFEDEDTYFQRKKSGEPTPISGLFKIRGLRDETQEAVGRIQPFELRKLHPDQYPAVLLVHYLNIVDKHRTLHLARRRTTEFFYGVLRDVKMPLNFSAPLGIIEDGAHLGDWTPTIFDNEPDMELRLGFEVAFGPTTPEVPEVEGEAVVPTLQRLISATNTILERLAATVP